MLWHIHFLLSWLFRFATRRGWLYDVLFNTLINPAHQFDLVWSVFDPHIERFLHVPDVNLTSISLVEELYHIEDIAFSKSIIENALENLEEPLMRDLALIEQVVAL